MTQSDTSRRLAAAEDRSVAAMSLEVDATDSGPRRDD
jgi:hypothetical protein